MTNTAKAISRSGHAGARARTASVGATTMRAIVMAFGRFTIPSPWDRNLTARDVGGGYHGSPQPFGDRWGTVVNPRRAPRPVRPAISRHPRPSGQRLQDQFADGFECVEPAAP